jgi:hypothetical protein
MQMGYPVKEIDRRLGFARPSIRDKDQSMYPQDATAFDSEGETQGDFQIKGFMEVAWPYYLARKPGEFVRAIGYTHVDHDGFHDLISDCLRSGNAKEDHVIAAGKCLRKPAHIAIFVQEFIRRKLIGGITQPWWRALSELLRFRGNALQEVSSDDCMTLLEMAIDVFSMEQKTGYGRELFRLPCLVIVYALRRRAFDDTFLDPESKLARYIKGQFLEARMAAVSGRLTLMGGSINLPEQLQLIIDYIDRKGKGQLLVGD